MAKARVIVKRRQAVRNIRKITRTMQLIATSRFQRAHNRALDSRPYAAKIAQLVDQLWEASREQMQHPLLERRAGNVGQLLVITSNRGLCGGYNGSLLRAAVEYCRAEQQADRRVRVDVVGRKGQSYLRFLGWPIEAVGEDIGDKPTFASVGKLADHYMDLFASEKSADTVHVVYMQFIKTGIQRPAIAQLLPLGQESRYDRPEWMTLPPPAAHLANFEFSPPPGELLAELLPTAVRTRLMQFFLDAVVGEHMARMTAMKSATENAEDMITLLTGQYNRARQGQITREISEIIGGAEALK